MNGERIYEVEYKDHEGDVYSDSRVTYPEFKDLVETYIRKGYEIVQTWKYIDGEYQGSVRGSWR